MTGGCTIHGRAGGRWRLLVGLALAALLQPCLAQAPQSLRFTRLAVEQGLPQESVIAIAQDRRGMVWLGTQAGLARYDGYSVRVFRHGEDGCSLSDNWIHALHLDRAGRLWIGTRAGVDVLDPGQACFRQLEPAGGIGGVHSIAEDRDGRIWLASSGVLLGLAAGGQVQHRLEAGTAGGLSPGPLGGLAVSPDGGLWVRTASGLDHLQPGAAPVHYPLQLPPPVAMAARYRIGAVMAEKDGSLWLGGPSGLSRWQPRNGHLQPLPVPAGMPADTGVSAFLRDRDGQLWIASGRGLLQLDAAVGAFIVHGHDRSDPSTLADNMVLSLYQDLSGSLWAGTWGNGASRTDLGSGGFGFLGAAGGGPLQLSDAKVYNLGLESPGVLWLATREGGINRLDLRRRQAEAFRHRPGDPHSLPTDAAMVALPDGRGGAWVGTDAGLGHLDRQGRYRAWPLPGPGAAAVIYQLYQRPGDPGLWACTRNGLYRLDPASGQVRVFRHDPADPDSIAADFVIGMLQDRRGRVWLATIDGGLDLFDPATGRARHYRHDPADPHSIGSNRVQALYEDRAGTLWIGTAAGVSRLESGEPGGPLRFRNWGTAEGLAVDSVGAILEDDEGLLWISTTAGISRLDPRSGAIRNYDEADGLPGGSHFVGAAVRDADGTLYFGGLRGVSVVRPKQVSGNPVPPLVAITDFQVFNRSIDEQPDPRVRLDRAWPGTTRLQMPSSVSVFSIGFAGLHFADPARNRYAYRLEGFDQEWIEVGAERRFATYTNLPPGRYVFRVRAANKDGVWAAEGASLELQVTPLWWQAWWFRLSALVAIAGAVLASYLYRVRRLQRQRLELERRVGERTAELDQARRELEHASLTDPLTGMRNRRFLGPQLESDLALAVRVHERALDAGGPPPHEADLVLLLVDIDHFKRVNDEHGHAAGDQILVEVHARLRRVLRESDYLVRWGGEEFLVVARGSHRDAAPAVASHIREVFRAEPFTVPGGAALTKTCSIGFTTLPLVPGYPDAVDWRRALDLADLALYAAKAAGRDGWVGIGAGPDADPRGWDHDLRGALPDLLARGQLRFATCLQPARVAAALQRRLD